jgi:SAM-dependent methyltransferase
MNTYLPGMEKERRDPALSQWFTPPALAMRIVDWALKGLTPVQPEELRVLEPSAGQGALAYPLRGFGCSVVCLDIDQRNVRELQRKGLDAHCENFIELQPVPGDAFDLAVMNPPFEDGQTEQHVLHALSFAPRVVCHCPLTTLAGSDRREGLWSTAYLKRLAICSTRPKYGAGSGMTDMCTVEVIRRPELKPKNGRVAASGVAIEWWP